MHPNFKEALDRKLVEIAKLPDGSDFVVDRVTYYQASENGANLMMKRFHAFGDMLRRHDTMKLTDEMVTVTLKTLIDLQRRALSQLSLEPEQSMDCIRETLTLIERMQQRREFGLDIAQVYEIASIWFFTENDDPADVDSASGKRFILAVTGAVNAAYLLAFFLSSPLGRYVPLSRLFDGDSLMSIADQNQLELLDWMRMSMKQDSLGLTSDTINTMQSRREILTAYVGLSDQLSSRTTST